eukprot:s905_g12.t1
MFPGSAGAAYQVLAGMQLGVKVVVASGVVGAWLYLRTLQNDIGKLAVLTCELRTTVRIAAATADGASLDKVRVSISCNEDGTFLVYTMPDAAGTLGSRCSSPASSSSQAPQELPSEVQPVIPVEAITEEAGAEHVLNNWVQKVCEFGMSGRCHSLTALFHFGYTAWKQLMHSSLQGERWGMESVEDISPGHIAEEEEKQSQVLFKEEPIDWQCEAQDRTHTLLTKLHELRKTPQKSPHTMTDTIQKKVESRLLAPSSPCLSTATRDSGVNSRESTHCLTPRDGSQDESGSPVFEADKTWLTDKEIGATAEPGKDLVRNGF